MDKQIIFSDEDSDLHNFKWRLDRHGYYRRYVSSRPTVTSFAHHDVCVRAFGRRPDWSKREVCDHINRNKLDNRRENLRITSIRENRNNSVPPKWATQLKSGRFQCQVSIKGVSRYIGCFDSESECTAAGNAFLDSIKRKTGSSVLGGFR